MSEKTRKTSVAVVENEHLATGSNAPGAAEHTLEQAIGHQVRHHRKHAGLTVAELAVASQISPGMLSKIENGQISPSLEHFADAGLSIERPADGAVCVV